MHPTPYRRIRHRVRARISESPTLYLPFARRKYPGPSPEVIGPDIELVIDGYTRSACTFAVYALQLSQPRPVRLAHHLHASAQLIDAARRGVPALLVIRPPRDAVLSQVVREPDVAVRDALWAYARFHASLLPCRDRLVVGEFEEVTHDFGSVLARLNDRFGTSLVPFEHTAERVAECVQLVALRDSLCPVLLRFESGLATREEVRRELRNSRLTDGSGTHTGSAWVPSAERDAAKARLRAQWDDSRNRRLVERAERLYESFAMPRERARRVTSVSPS